MKGLIRLSSSALLLAMLLVISGCSKDTSEESRPPAETEAATQPEGSAQFPSVDLIALPPPPSPTPEEEVRGGGIEGRVLGPSGAAVAGCEVILLRMGTGAHADFVDRGRYRQSEPFATTGADGRFRVNEIASGTFTVAFRASGCAHEEYPEQVEIRTGQMTRGIVQRLKPGGVIFGEVLENLTGEPLPGVKVIARTVSKSRLEWPVGGVADFTNARGNFRLDVLPLSERYDLEASREEYATARVELLETDTGEPVRIVMSRPGRVEGRVVRADGAPVPGASVLAFGLRKPDREVQSATDGEFVFPYLDPGEYWFKAQKDGWYSKPSPEYRLEVAPYGRMSLDLILLPGAVLEITVIDANTKEPVAGAEVQLRRRKMTLLTNQDGVARCEGLDEGESACCLVMAEGYVKSDSSIPVSLGETATGTIELKPSRLRRLSGIVVDEADQPVSAALVEVASDSGPHSTVTGADGTFYLEFYREGAYVITTTKEGFASVKTAAGKTDEEEEVRIVLQKGGTIEGIVVDARGNGLEGFAVEAKHTSGSGHPISSRSDEYGRWKIEHVHQETFSIQARKGELRSNQVKAIQVSWTDHIEGIRLVVPDRFSVSGSVVDWRDRKGVPSIRIELAGSSTRTDEAGRFVLKDIPSGLHYLEVKDIPQPYVPTYGLRSEKRVSVIDRDVTGLVLEVRKGGTVSGKVLLPSGEAAVGAEVVLVDPSNDTKGKQLKSDTEGNFEFDALQPAESYLLFAFLEEHAPARSEKFALEEGEIVEGITLRLPVPGKVSGTIRDASGNPPSEGYQLVTELIDVKNLRQPIGRARPDQSGRYLIDHLPPGRINLKLRVKGPTTWSHGGLSSTWTVVQEQMVEIISGYETTGVDFFVPVKEKEEQKKLEPNAFIAGRVVDRQGRAIPGVNLWASATDFPRKLGKGGVGSTTTDPDGSFRIENLSEGDFWLTAKAQDPDYPRVHMRNISSPSENVEIVLGKFATIDGRVVLQSTGEPVENFFLSYRRGRPKQFIRDADGRFRIEKLEPESYRIRVEAEGLGADERVITVEYDQHVRDLVFRLGSRTIKGRVIRKGSGAPVSRARVIPGSLNPPQHTLGTRVFGTRGQCVTGPDGRFSVTVDVPGTQTLIVEHPDFGLSRFPDVVIPEDKSSIEVILELEQPGGIVGHGYHESGEPFQDSTVSVVSSASGYGSEFKTRTDHEGYYEFPQLQPGTYCVRWERQAIHGSADPWTWRVEVRAGETRVVDLGLGRTTVTGTLTRGGELTLLRLSFVSETCSRTTFPDMQGHYWIRGLTPGTYAVTVSDFPEKEILLTDEVTVPREGEIHLDFDCRQNP